MYGAVSPCVSEAKDHGGRGGASAGVALHNATATRTCSAGCFSSRPLLRRRWGWHTQPPGTPSEVGSLGCSASPGAPRVVGGLWGVPSVHHPHPPRPRRSPCRCARRLFHSPAESQPRLCLRGRQPVGKPLGEKPGKAEIEARPRHSISPPCTHACPGAKHPCDWGVLCSAPLRSDKGQGHARVHRRRWGGLGLVQT
jgi:hypothetical protein